MIEGMSSNIINFIIGFSGWFLATAPTWFENINGFIAITSSSMGLILLFITIRTGIVNHRLKRIELERKNKEHKEWLEKFSRDHPNAGKN